MRRALGLTVLLFAVACDKPGVGQVRPRLSPPPAEVDFETVPVLNGKQLDIPVINAGRVSLHMTNVALDHDDGIFTFKAPAEEVAAGVTENIVVTFEPLKEQLYENTLRFNSDDDDFPTLEVKLKGTGSTRAAVEVMPATLDFDVVNECASGVQQLTVTSKGTADLIIEEIGFTEGTDPGFAFVGSTRTPVTVKTLGSNGLPGELQLTVRYVAMAGAMGTPMGGIRLKTTDPEKQELIIPLKATVNQAPVPNIAMFGNAAPGDTVALDGSGSSDPDGNTPLTYKWTLRSKPLASNTTIEMTDVATTSMRLDASLPGSYEVQLDVTDALGAKSCQPARATVVAKPAQALLIELFWDNPGTDLDLHVLRNAQQTFGSPPGDCYYQNRTPDWGTFGDTSDDPELVRDALTGYGPEVFGYINPISTNYRVLVAFENDLLNPMPASRATVRVYQYGVLKAEASKTLTRRGDVWEVFDVAWPTGNVTVLQ